MFWREPFRQGCFYRYLVSGQTIVKCRKLILSTITNFELKCIRFFSDLRIGINKKMPRLIDGARALWTILGSVR